MAGKNYTTAPSSRQTFNGQGVRRISGSAMMIATWNVRSMFGDGRLENVLKEMKRMKINLLGISDTRWIGSGSKVVDEEGNMIYYSGNNDRRHLYGVAIIVDKEIRKSIESFTPISDRIMMIKIKTKIGYTNVIQVYAPTADKADEEVEAMYQDLQNLLKTTKQEDVNIIIGDFNAKVGSEAVHGCTGMFGLGDRNERGDRLVEFCQNEDFVIMNTTFKLPKRRLYTWKAPGDGINNAIRRNQIDYILIKRRFRNAVKSTKTYPGADVSSDHNPVVAKIEVRLKKVERKNNKKKTLDLSKLKNDDVADTIKQNVSVKMIDIKHQNAQTENVDEKWENIKTVLIKEGEDLLKPERIRRKPWITDEILDLMDERRRWKNIDVQKYKTTNKEIKKKIKEAKEKRWSEECSEIERYDRMYDSFNLHKKIKELTGTQKKKQSGILKNNDGEVITNVQDKIKHWTEYIKELFQDDRPPLEITTSEDSGRRISKEEIEYVLKRSKTKKAPGPDDVPTELLKIMDDNGLEVLVDLFNSMYDLGSIPKEWLTSTFITLPKKTNAKECSDYRTIALMSHTLKLFLKIIHLRIYKKLEADISDSQFGFRAGMGTREALFAINILIQKSLDVNKDIYACFIDFEKAFDKVQHEKLKQILVGKNINSKDIQIITSLYWNQTAKVKVDEDLSEDIMILRGVRQGCVLSPLLFNTYSEAIFQETLTEHMTKGIKIDNDTVNNIRYADDTVMLAESKDDLQQLVNNLNMKCREYGLKMNLKKTKIMLISKTLDNNLNLTIDGIPLEKVSSYKYLGTWLNENNDQTKEIRCRIEIARNAFIKLKKCLCSRDINLQLRTRVLKCYVFSTPRYCMGLKYGLEEKQ
uniref:Craniofacial development protein 2 n=1 Tax=Cacopsylla melanoneura TaxID=428564 RepID=A0A8D8M2B6_9HEMI